ncbi:hypothetical protein D3C77_717140 [compost metagenome]
MRLEVQQADTQRLEACNVEQQQTLAAVQSALHTERLQFHQRQAAQWQHLQSLRALLSRATSALQARGEASASGAAAAGVSDSALLGWLDEAGSLLEEDTSSEPAAR